MTLVYILVMAGVTYLVRMLPLVIFKRKIENRFVKSFMYYIPFAVLGAMTFPAVFSSTASLYSAAAGTAVALFLSFKEKSLLTVALAACITVYMVELLIH
ncbi:MAG TPA: AzlD domain-containing protein [Clostridia bacterium]|nr:AzlD domain-containing protein [Clostridia bacterium]